MPGTFSRQVNGRIHIWYQDHLKLQASDLPVFEKPLSEIRELDSDIWFNTHSRPTVRLVAEHASAILNANLNDPVIFDADGRLMDGFHRLARAYQLNYSHIKARQFSINPEPDEIDLPK